LTGERAYIAGNKLLRLLNLPTATIPIHDSDDAEVPEPGLIIYDERAAISVADAIAWDASLPFATTLYLYDLGSGLRVGRLNVTMPQFP
jgi:hypothetical protein